MKKLLMLSLVFLSVSIANAEDLNAIFKRVNDLVTQKNYTKALEELTWAKKEIEKLNTTQISTFFPDSLNGYTGGKPELNNALGITNFERTYKKGDAEVKLSLTGGSGGAAGLGGIAALGKMAALMGTQEGQDTFRIAGRTATLNENSGRPELSVFLDSGSILQIEAENNAKSEELRGIAEALKIADLDTYLRGGQG